MHHRAHTAMIDTCAYTTMIVRCEDHESSLLLHEQIRRSEDRTILQTATVAYWRFLLALCCGGIPRLGGCAIAHDLQCRIAEMILGLAVEQVRNGFWAQRAELAALRLRRRGDWLCMGELPSVTLM